MKMWHVLGKGLAIFVHGLNAACSWIAGVMLVFMALFLCANILGRDFFGHSYIGTTALGTWLMVWITFLGAAVIIPRHGNVRIDLLLRAFTGRVSLMRIATALVAVIGIIFSAVLFVLSVEFTNFMFGTGQIETTLSISPGYVYISVAIGTFVMLVNYIDLLVAILRKDDTRLPMSAAEEVQREIAGDGAD